MYRKFLSNLKVGANLLHYHHPNMTNIFPFWFTFEKPLFLPFITSFSHREKKTHFVIVNCYRLKKRVKITSGSFKAFTKEERLPQQSKRTILQGHPSLHKLCFSNRPWFLFSFSFSFWEKKKRRSNELHTWCTIGFLIWYVIGDRLWRNALTTQHPH
jgi:hypothetical protein